MRAKEYKQDNSSNVGAGGNKISLDPFNKAKKGSERFPEAKEYASTDVEEYSHYDENVDIRADDDKKQDDPKKKDLSKRSSKARSRARLARSIISKVVVVVVGGIITVAGYRAVKSNSETVADSKIEWVWSSDYSTANVRLYNVRGTILVDSLAKIVITQKDPTCTEEGLSTYVATTEYKGKTYSDERSVSIAPKGHHYGAPKIVIIDGVETMIFECEECHEQVTISIDPVEEDA